MRPRYVCSAIVWWSVALGAAAGPPDLPEPRANNAVARLVIGDLDVWLSAAGLGAGKHWQDIRADAWLYRPGDRRWQVLPGLPDGVGRLGSHAVALAGQLVVIGGYSVDEHAHEVSTPALFALQLDPAPAWIELTRMPVPVDDAVALVHAQRWLYLLSGWSDTGNVNLVQRFDGMARQWTQVEPWPGAPVFGHAGGLVGDRLVICGGARIHYPEHGPRQFVSSPECWLATIRATDSRRLDWKPIAAMPGPPRYRAGAAGARVQGADRVLFAGGSDRPYNYDGIGYDGEPAAALDTIVSFNLDLGVWECHGRAPAPSMDHRGLIVDGEDLVLIGGLDRDRNASARVVRFALEPPHPCES